MKRIVLSTCVLAVLLPSTADALTLYFPHISANDEWKTEVGIVNADNSSLSATMTGYDGAGGVVWSRPVNLPPLGRVEWDVHSQGANATRSKSMILTGASGSAVGYVKYQSVDGIRAGVEAMGQGAGSRLYLPHIASNDDWWTGVALFNPTGSPKTLTLTFNTGEQRTLSLQAGGHHSFLVRQLFEGAIQPSISSATVDGASGVMGVQLFGGEVTVNLAGIPIGHELARDLIVSHYPDAQEWWSGFAFYNPQSSTASLGITYYDDRGARTGQGSLSVQPRTRWVGEASALSIPEGTTWFRVSSNLDVTGFMLIQSIETGQLSGHSLVGKAARAAAFPKLERDGWTGVALVNTEATSGRVRFQAVDDAGTVVAATNRTIEGNGKIVGLPATLFSNNVTSATHIRYLSDRRLVGLQLNGSSDHTLLDALPTLPVTADACLPLSCWDVQANCGQIDDGCGGTVDCGACPAGQTCGAEQPNRCGVVPCVATTCAAENAECGTISDGCGQTLTCGNCRVGEVCGAAGPNRCGPGDCAAITCEQANADCGVISDGCGGTRECGECPAGDTCGASAPNVCGVGVCTPITCEEVGAECGMISDGCEYVLPCGTCPEGEACGEDEPNRCGKPGDNGGVRVDAGGCDCSSTGAGGAGLLLILLPLFLLGLRSRPRRA